MKNKPLIDEYLKASGSGPASRSDLQLPDLGGIRFEPECG